MEIIVYFAKMLKKPMKFIFKPSYTVSDMRMIIHRPIDVDEVEIQVDRNTGYQRILGEFKTSSVTIKEINSYRQ